MAIATFREGTTKREHTQGVMRMRQLFTTQQITHVVTHTAVEKIPHAGPHLTMWDLILHSEANETKIQKDDLFRSVVQKLQNAARREVLDLMFGAKTEEEEAQIFSHARALFIRSTELGLYEQFGRAPIEMEMEAFLNQLARGFLASVPEAAQAKVEAVMRGIIEKALPKLDDKTTTNVVNSWGQEATMEQVDEIQAQQERLTLQEYEVDTDRDLDLQEKVPPAEELPWERLPAALEVVPFAGPAGDSRPLVHSLSDVMEKNPVLARYAPCFPSSLLVTSNFLETRSGEVNLLSKMQKEGWDVLLYLDKGSKTWKPMLCTLKEATFFKEQIRADLQVPYRLIGPRGAPIAGELPEELDLDPLLVPILLLNNDLAGLSSPRFLPLFKSWAADHREELWTLLQARGPKEYKGSPIEEFLAKEGISDESYTEAARFACINRNPERALDQVEPLLRKCSLSRLERVPQCMMLLKQVLHGVALPEVKSRAKRMFIPLIHLMAEAVEAGEIEGIREALSHVEDLLDPEILSATKRLMKGLIDQGEMDLALKLAKSQVRDLTYLRSARDSKRFLPARQFSMSLLPLFPEPSRSELGTWILERPCLSAEVASYEKERVDKQLLKQVFEALGQYHDPTERAAFGPLLKEAVEKLLRIDRVDYLVRSEILQQNVNQILNQIPERVWDEFPEVAASVEREIRDYMAHQDRLYGRTRHEPAYYRDSVLGALASMEHPLAKRIGEELCAQFEAAHPDDFAQRAVVERIEYDPATGNGPEPDDGSFLHKAVQESDAERLLEILKTAPKWELLNKQGQTPLHLAANMGWGEGIPALIALVDAGAPLDEQDHRGKTALHYAAERGKKDAVEYLVKHGARKNITDNEYNTPEFYGSHSPDIVALLREDM